MSSFNECWRLLISVIFIFTIKMRFMKNNQYFSVILYLLGFVLKKYKDKKLLIHISK